MPVPALELVHLRGELDPRALADRKVLLRVEGGALRLSAEGLRRLLPASAPITLDNISGGRAQVTVRAFGLLEGVLEVAVRATAHGRARLEAVSARAGFLPIPLFLVAAALPSLLPSRPGLYLGQGASVEIDLAALAEPHGVSLPPLQEARAEAGVLELRFS